MAVDYLSSLNAGSGLNNTEIIESLVNAERAPKENLINNKRDKRTVEISGLGQTKQGFETLKTGLVPVTGVTGLSASSATSAVSLEITDPDKASAFSSSIIIDSVAAAQTLVFGGHASETASTGAGSLTLSFGTWAANGSFTSNGDRSDVTVQVTSANNTLAGLRDAINTASDDVNASILKTSASTYALVIRSKEGASHAMRISAAEDSGAPGLAGFAYTAVDNSVQTVAGADASLRLDGTTITRETNSITDLIDGVGLTLNATSTTAATIQASHDTAKATTAMQTVVDNLNTLQSELATLTKRATGNEEDGPLAGDALLRSLQNRLRSYTTTPITGFGADAVYLADFGVMTAQDGSISLDKDKFQIAYEANPDSFAAITNSRITSSSALVSPSSVGQTPKAGSYQFDIAADSSATLDGTAMTANGSVYSISTGDAAGLNLTISGSGADATIYVGKSLIESLSDFATNVLALNSDLNTKIQRYNDDLTGYDEELTDLDTRIESIRARYVTRFAAMETTVASFKKTGESLDHMMDSWQASLKA